MLQVQCNILCVVASWTRAPPQDLPGFSPLERLGGVTLSGRCVAGSAGSASRIAAIPVCSLSLACESSVGSQLPPQPCAALRLLHRRDSNLWNHKSN